MPRLRSDQGSATSEFVVTAPILIGFLSLVILAGRLVDARSDVIGAANDAARIASLQQTGDAAAAQAGVAAEDSVAQEGIDCSGGGPTVQTNFLPDGFERGNTVHVTVTCEVDVSDLAFLNLGVLNMDIEAEAWEPIDEHRSLP